MKKLILTLSILSCFNAVADLNENSVWQNFGQNEKNISSILSDSPLSTLSAEGAMKQRRLILDVSLLKNKLSQLDPFIVSGKAAKATILSPLTSEISLPLPDGSMLRVIATPSRIISAEAAEAHPELKTWSVRGIDDPDISGVIDFTANGFHGMLLMPDGDTIFIDPDKKQSGDVYNSFSKQENTNAFNVALNCGTHEDHDHQSHIADPEFAIKAAAKALPVSNFPDVSISRIKTYRLAMSATAEYTLEQGGTAGAFSAMMTSINRINPLFERDLGIKLELLDLPELIFVNADSDPFSQPNNPSALMIANGQYLSGQDLGQDIVRNRLDDFDIGHVLSHRTDIRGGSGVAFLGVVCEDQSGGIAGIKAAGATTSSNPDGETFDLVLLAHELGHQLGGNHTFNSVSSNNCANGRSGSVAVEPGSGSSIMAYAGLCSRSDNLIENPRDDFFHFASISQIYKNTRIASPFINGASCGTFSDIVPTGTITAAAGADIKIPANTPFLLDGTASGGTSSWDQIDIGNASSVDVDVVDPIDGGNAIIRHIIPTANQDRYIPRLTNLFTGTSTRGEIVPTNTRELNFAYVVRNNGVESDKKLINVTDTGSAFSVTSQASDQIFSTDQSIDVSWNIAGTDQANIACNNVDIQLIRVDGVKNMLLASTPNDGTQNLSIPASTPELSGARIFVGCSDNSFFNISSGNITVEKAIIVDTTKPVITIQGANPVSIVEGASYKDAGATANDNVDGIIVVNSTGIVNTNTVGVYTINYTATDNAGNSETAIRTVNVTAAPVVPVTDTTAPVITLNGASTIEITQGSSYSDAGATAVDNVDGTITVISTGNVNTNLAGTYTISYSATDAAGNINIATRIVNVIALPDTTAPVITVNGASTIEITQGTAYLDAGAIALDNVDGTITVTSTGNVNINVIGTYTISYSATDTAGNSASTNRIINVTAAPVVVIPDTTAPVITINGNNSITIIEGTSYSDAGATAIDNIDGNITVTSTGSVNINSIGTYTIRYSASDNAGNSVSAARTVNVIANPSIDNNLSDTGGGGGGSFGYLLVPLMILLGLRRPKPIPVRVKKTK